MLHIKKASAGSGKTYSLTGKYLSMLLGERGEDGKMHLYGAGDYGFLKTKPHSRILAITFTNKSTAEMTARIISRLDELANATDRKRIDHRDDLCALYGCDDATLAAAARRALSDVLFNFSWFNVSTIDSFFQNVLRVFTRELDLPEDFSLELDEVSPVELAVGKLMSDINRPAYGLGAQERHARQLLSGWLQKYMEQYIDEGSNANLFLRGSSLQRQLIGDIARLRNEFFRRNYRDIKAYMDNPDAVEGFYRGMNDALKKRADEIRRVAEAFVGANDLSKMSKRLREQYLEAWSRGDFSYSVFDDKGKLRTILPSAVPADNSPASLDATFSKRWTAKATPSPEDDAALVDILRLGLQYFYDESMYRTLRRQIYMLALFSAVGRRIEEYCREEDAFLLADTSQLLHSVICAEEVPFVYDRIGYNIRHFLIDEFQDTSEMQWDCLWPLVYNSLGEGNDNLIIGDEKQCIYRFRNSRPELLGSIVEEQIVDAFGLTDAASRSEMIDVRGRRIADNTNFRSCRNVVVFNNSLFAAMVQVLDREFPDAGVGRTYSTLVQQVCDKHRDNPEMGPGYVKVVFPPETGKEKPDDKDAPEAGAGTPDEAGTDAPEETAEIKWEKDTTSLRLMGEEIHRQLLAGYSPADIAVLVRSHDEGRKVIEFLLNLMHTPGWKCGKVDIVSSDALAISTSPAINLLVGILRLTTTPQYIQDYSRKPETPEERENPEFLRNRLIHRYEVELARHTEPDEALRIAVEATSVRIPGTDDAQWQNVLADERGRRTDRECPNLYAMVEHIIGKFLSKELRDSEAAFITAFQDMVMEYEERGQADVEEFLDFWDNKGKYTTLPLPEGMAAITVTTIHKSKGLEYPCVHIPFLTRRMVDIRDMRWFELDRDAFPGIDPAVVPQYMPLKASTKLKQFPMFADAVNEMERTQLVDALNVAYVAFTRAGRELIIYADTNVNRPGADGKPSTMASLMFKAVEQLRDLGADDKAVDRLLDGEDRDRAAEMRPWLDGVGRYLDAEPKGRPVATPLTTGYTGLGDDEQPHYCARVLEYGAPTSPFTEKKEAEAAAEAPREDAFPKQVLEYTGDEGGRPKSFDASIPYDTVLEEYNVERPDEMLLASEQAEEMIYDTSDERGTGIFLHDVLARVRHIADLPGAMERQAYRYGVEERVWRGYLDRLTQAISAESVRPWFEEWEEVMNERPFTAATSLKRPDRIVVMPGGETVVIDYKFGAPYDADGRPSHELKRYCEQVRDYMALLSACGYTPVTGYIFYPLKSLLIPVS